MRIFNCWVCGTQVGEYADLTDESESHRQEKEQTRKMLSGIGSIEEVFQVLGPPDQERGAKKEVFYFDGVRTEFSTKRTLFYNHLSINFKVVFSEFTDNSVQYSIIEK